MCRPGRNSVNGAPLKGCIVWTLTKPNWFGQILTDWHVNRERVCCVCNKGLCMTVPAWEWMCAFMRVCASAVFCFTHKYPLFCHQTIKSSRAVNIPTTDSWSIAVMAAHPRWVPGALMPPCICVSSWLLVTVHFCCRRLLSMHSYLLWVQPTIWPL